MITIIIASCPVEVMISYVWNIVSSYGREKIRKSAYTARVTISDSCNHMSGKRAAANQHWGWDNGTTICAWSESREVSSLGFGLESRALLKGSGL